MKTRTCGDCDGTGFFKEAVGYSRTGLLYMPINCQTCNGTGQIDLNEIEDEMFFVDALLDKIGSELFLHERFEDRHADRIMNDYPSNEDWTE